MNNNRLSIQILFAPFKMFRSLRFKITLLLIAGTLCLINAQEPEFASPAHNPFGLMTEPGKASAIRKADFDHDDTAEIIVLLAESGVVEIKYYENEGDDEAPSFVFHESNPFGLLPGQILLR